MLSSYLALYILITILKTNKQEPWEESAGLK